MRLETDDDIYAVDNVYLGPPGYTFPWRARYFAYGLWFALVVVGLIVERATVGLGVWPIVYLLLGAVLVTRVVGRRVSHDVPVRAIGSTLAHEVAGPRRLWGGARAESDLRRVKVRTRLDRS